MAGYLTTHVLDTARGVPARGLSIELLRRDGDVWTPVASATTNDDGRTDVPILPAERFRPGSYELVFRAGDYMRRQGMDDGFLDEVPVRFRMSEATHYHVPLLLSPFSFATYRGS